MSINITDLIKIDLWKWLVENSDSDATMDASAFWVNPIAPTEPDFESMVATELALLKQVSGVETYRSPHVAGVRMLVGDEVVACVHGYESATELSNVLPQIYERMETPFLLAVYVATRLGLPATSPVPARLLLEAARDGLLADDLRQYLPPLSIYKLSADYRRYGIELLFPVICCDIFRHRAGKWVGDDALNLLMSVPEKGHDWLLREFLDVISAKQLGAMYLQAYRIVEFFFPLLGVNNLRKGLSEKVDMLSILAKCRESLGWYWQHGKSARASASMATTRGFVQPLYEVGLIGSVDCSLEDAAEKLVNLRNSLSHQDFRLISHDDEVLKGAIRSALIFCAEAFARYASWASEIDEKGA